MTSFSTEINDQSNNIDNTTGQLASVIITTDGTVDTESPEVTYTYTATGAINKIDFKGTKDADYGYTIRDWVKSINPEVFGASPAGNFAAFYDYTDNGNVNNAEYHNPQVQTGGGPATHQWVFGYDGLNRLTDANFEGSSTKFDVSGLSYDKSGNIDSLRRNDETGSLIDDLSYSYQPGTNRLGSISDAVAATTEDWDAESATFGYDNNENLISQSGKINNITYEHRNLPTHFDLSSGSDLYTGYNADGQRVLKESSGGTWQFYVMDGPQTLAVIDQNGFSHFNLTGNATFGRWEPGGTRRYYITDHLGSTRAVVDDGGNVLETFDYYPFGLLMPKRNTAGAGTLEKFTGKERDTEGNLNLDYFGARYYDPAVGRWHSVDPKADKFPGLTPYNYIANNPILASDPDGQDFTIDIKRDKDGNITGLTFTANVYVGDKKSFKAAQKAAAQWNAVDGNTEIGGFFKRLFSNDSDVKVSVSVNVIQAKNRIDALAKATKDDAGNFLSVLNENTFEANYKGKNDPRRVGGTVASNNFGNVPETRQGQNANLTGRTAHEIGHFFGLRDPASGSGGSGVMGYPSGNTASGFLKIPTVSQRDIGKVGARWRRTIRQHPGASLVRFKNGKIERIK